LIHSPSADTKNATSDAMSSVLPTRSPRIRLRAAACRSGHCGTDRIPVTAEVYCATGGYYCRFAISHTDGAVLSLEPTIEDVVTRFDEIRGAGTVPNEVDGDALVSGLQSFVPRLSGQRTH